MSENLKNKIDILFKKFNSGKHSEAFKDIEILVKKNNTNFELITSYAIMANKLNYTSKAIKSFTYVLKKQPSNIICLHNLYVIFLKKNFLDKALDLIEKIIKINHHHYEALRDKAYILYLKGNTKNAIEIIEKALKENNKDVFGLNVKGLIFLANYKTKEAIKIFEKAILINSNYPDSYNNLGKCFYELENLELAFQNFKKAFRINPQFDLAIINIANVLSLKDKNITAINFYNKALKINPSKIELYSNITICYCRLKDLENAKKNYSKASNLLPKDYDLHLSFAYLLLYYKQYSKAWKLFDSRLSIPRIKKMNLTHDVVKDKLIKEDYIKETDKLLIIREQGVGDEILFSSIYNNLLEKFKNVKIETDIRLKKIFKRSFKKNIFYSSGYFSSNKKEINNFDKIIYAGSLTKHFRKKEENFTGLPYLTSNEKKDTEIKNQIIKLGSKSKIGISWKSVVNIYGKLKSLQIKDFEPIFSKNRTVINVQYGEVLDEINRANKKGMDIFTFKEIDLFNDFDSCLSILKNLDVFVTVSNSTAHIAGALGVPTIVICPKKASTYYYWDYDNSLTPWYKSIRIIKFKNSIKNTMNEVNKIINDLTWK